MSQAHKKGTSPPPPIEQRQVQSDGSPSSSDEKAFLRGQLAEMRDYDQRLIATVYWSLSGVFLVVVVVAGLNLFANYRVYERERDSLRNEVAAQAKLVHSELEQRFHKLSQSLVATEQENADDLKRHLIGEIKKSVTAEAQQYSGQIHSAHQRLPEALYRDTEFRARYYESKNENYEAFGLWIENLEHMKEVGWLWSDMHVGDVLKRLMAILKKGQSISYTFQKRLIKVLDGAPPVLSTEVELLKALMNNVPRL